MAFLNVGVSHQKTKNNHIHDTQQKLNSTEPEVECSAAYKQIRVTQVHWTNHKIWKAHVYWNRSWAKPNVPLFTKILKLFCNGNYSMKYKTQSELINKSFCTLRSSFTWYVLKRQLQHTLTGRFTPRPHSCGMTCTSTVSHQVVADITTVGGCLSKGCSSSVTNLAIGWLSQSTTVHVCQKKRYIFIMLLCLENWLRFF